MSATPPTPPTSSPAPGAAAGTNASGPHHRRHHWATGVAVVVGLLVGGVAICEWMGWPFLRRPLENLLSQKLERSVSFDGSGETRWTLRFIGGIRLRTDSLQISGPSWSTMGPMLVAQDARLALRYSDLLDLRHGQPLRVKALEAGDLALRIERDVEGRASWQFGRQPDSATQVRERPRFDGVRFDLLEVRQGSASVDDKIQRLSLLAKFALRESWDLPPPDQALLDRADIQFGRDSDGASAPSGRTAAASSAAPRVPLVAASAPAGFTGSARLGSGAASGAAQGQGQGQGDLPRGMVATAEGHFRDMPIKASLRTGSALPWLSSDPNAPAVPVTLRGGIGNARLSFDGEVRDLLVSQGLTGRYEIAGPSLAAVGEPLGVTLPTTPPFAMKGTLKRDGSRWATVVQSATIGKSKLHGHFEFDKPPTEKAKLTGELLGRELWLADLGPSIGVPTDRKERVSTKANRVLPDKQFDLPSLRAMDADVAVNLDRFESGTALLQAAQPLRGRIVLQDGVLDIRDIDARVARGQFAGRIKLDGRQPTALWEVRLRVTGVHLEQWLQAKRDAGKPPYVTGLMGGRISLDGRGRSTADLLATADGRMVLYWTQGTVSHLIVEAAGLDVAQALGVLIRGDKDLPVQCGIADLKVKDGRVTPQPMVVDTRDSLVRVDGDISLATERMALRAKVEPKDFSPLTLRTPIKVEGTLSDPDIGVEKAPLLRKVVPAAVLGVAVAPLAALIPLVDLGEDPDDQSKVALSECNAAFAGAAKRRPGS
ncbi:AsmA family protein [Roseateles sp. YR242]|uniref:AsmA family protein n=1 Tax=Roseateles sp. YR242 TaxID=1855305 RepID=UPI0008C1C717|nr:AsmA family protein [Roseateles sp. YR242]SEL06742.1 AsmA family protein [Roseateles sp. YR242]